MIVLLNYAVMLKLLPELRSPGPSQPARWWCVLRDHGSASCRYRTDGRSCWRRRDCSLFYQSPLKNPTPCWGEKKKKGWGEDVQILAVIAQPSHKVCLKIIHNLMLLSDPCLGFLHTNSAVGDKRRCTSGWSSRQSVSFLPTCLFS